MLNRSRTGKGTEGPCGDHKLLQMSSGTLCGGNKLLQMSSGALCGDNKPLQTLLGTLCGDHKPLQALTRLFVVTTRPVMLQKM